MKAPLNRSVAVLGTGSYLPARVLTNESLRDLITNYDESHSGDFSTWVDRVTHIHERRFIESYDEDAGYMAAEASRHAPARALPPGGPAPVSVGGRGKGAERPPAAGLRIGFVCTGNTCRSPMAEGLARSLLTRRLGSEDLAAFGFRILSMGVFAGSGSPASEHAVEALAAQKIDISEHRSQPAVPEIVRELDRVYALTQGHLSSLKKMLPPNRVRHLSLLDPDGEDVSDPIGGTLDDYRRCAEKIRSALEARLDEWA